MQSTCLMMLRLLYSCISYTPATPYKTQQNLHICVGIWFWYLLMLLLLVLVRFWVTRFQHNVLYLLDKQNKQMTSPFGSSLSSSSWNPTCCCFPCFRQQNHAYQFNMTCTTTNTIIRNTSNQSTGWFGKRTWSDESQVKDWFPWERQA